MPTKPFPIPRVRRAKGYRSKHPATDVEKQVGAWTYSQRDLDRSVRDEGCERRDGITATGSQAPVGLLGLQLARGARVHTRS